MRIRIFQSGKGDCLLLTTRDGKNVLVDGGVPAAYKEHVASFLGKMRRNNNKIDLVYVSHIDQDHIGGILKMLDTAVDWRIYDYQRSKGNNNFRRPSLPKPPEVGSIWHNAFFHQLSMNTPDIVQTLTHSGAMLGGSQQSWLSALGSRHQFLGQSVGEAIQVSRRIGKDQLNISLNPEHDGNFMIRRDNANPNLSIGSLTGTLLSPTQETLRNLIDTWNAYLRGHRDYIRRLIREQKQDEANLPSEQPGALARALNHRAEDFQLDREDVTPPNLASIMILFEEDGKRLLFTGDGAWEDIIDGLEAHGLLDDEGRIHVNVLKVPHHGAHNSFNDEFVQKVIADHYIFCGDGEHHNPEPEVISGYLKSRLGSAYERSTHPNTGQRFKFWFTCSNTNCKPEHKTLWKSIRRIMSTAMNRHPGRLRYRFLSRGHSMILDL